MSVKAELTERDRRYLERSLNGPVWKVVLSVGAPLALYQELAMIFTVMDTMMAAHISKESVSAVAYLAQVNLILTAVGGGLAVGAGIQISRAYGEGDLELVRKRVSSLYALSLSVGLAMLALILPFTVQFLRLAGTPEELIAVGSRYFMVQMFVMVFNFLNNVYIAVERARGNAKRIFVLNILVILVKLSLTAFFVYILRSGLVMVAVASLCSELAMFVFALHFSLAGENAFSFSAKAVTLQGRVTAPMVIQSLPVIAEKALFAFGKTIVNSMCTVYGAVMVGAMGVSDNLGGVTTNPQNGFQQGSSAIISQNFGAGKYDRVLRTFYVTIAVNVLMSAVITGIEILNLDLLAGLFDSESSEFHRMITMVYRFEAYGAIPLGINAAVLALLYGLGKTKLTLVLNFSRVFLFRIPVFWFLQNYTDLGEVSVGIVMMVSNISVTVMAVSVAAVVIARFRKEYPAESVNTACQGA